MSAVKRSRTRRLLRLSGLVWLLAITAAHASDNSKSTLEVFELLEEAGSRPISNTPPPPINITPKPLSTWQQVQAKVSALLQQVAAQQQVLAEQQAALTSAQATLAEFQGQAAALNKQAANALANGQDANTKTLADEAAEVTQTFVPTWTKAVTTDQNLVAAVQAQIAQLQAQIAAIQAAQ